METSRQPFEPDPDPSDPTTGDIGERLKRRRAFPEPFQPPDTVIFSAGSSWSDKLQPQKLRADVDFAAASKNTEIQHVKLRPSGSLAIPTITIADELLRKINEEWSHAIIIKLPGRPWNIDVLRGRFEHLCDLRGKYDLVDVGPNLFILRELNPLTRETILTKGPWKIAGLFLAIQKWYPDFDPTTYKVTTAITWVRIPHLPAQFYREAILLQIARGIGEPIKADANTFNLERGRFARLCVQVDLTKPLERAIDINQRHYSIIYENLQTLC